MRFLELLSKKFMGRSFSYPRILLAGLVAFLLFQATGSFVVIFWLHLPGIHIIGSFLRKLKKSQAGGYGDYY